MEASGRSSLPGGSVVVIGAGPGGLAAAHVLSERGVDVRVLELQDYVGGLCLTLERGGFRFDLGGHRWFTKNEELHRWFLELMKGELCQVKRISRIYFGGKYFDYPISIRNVIGNAGILTSGHAALSYLWWAAKDLVAWREPENIRDAYCVQFGRKLFEMFFRRYTEKVWGQPCEELSADWVTQRTKGLSILSALRDAIGTHRNVVSLIDEFVYPRLGYQRICIRMAEDIEKKGGAISLSSPVRGLRCEGPGRWKVSYDSAEGPREIEVTDVISTLPLSHLVQMVEPAADEAVAECARSLRFRDLITVTVMLEKPQVTPDTWLYVHDEELIFARLHEPKNWSPDMVPGPEYTSVVCECFCTQGDAVWGMDDAAISDRVVEDLSGRLGFITPREVIDTCVVRTRYAYPVYDLDYRRKLAVIEGFLNRHPGLHIAGRGGTFRYNNADHSIEMGQLLARKFLGDAQDHMGVNTDKDYHEETRRTSTRVPG